MVKIRKEGAAYPTSAQAALFNYLKPEQQEFVRPLLRVLKKPAQVQLCYMLLDYMETGEVEMGMDVVVGGMFTYITRFGMCEAAKADPRIVRPLGEKKSTPQTDEDNNKFTPLLY